MIAAQDYNSVEAVALRLLAAGTDPDLVAAWLEYELAAACRDLPVRYVYPVSA